MPEAFELFQSPIRDFTSDDQITYSFDTANYGGSPTGVSMEAINLHTGIDVSDVVLTGSASVSGDVITMEVVASLQPKYSYAIDIIFTCAGNQFKRRLVIQVGNA